MTWIKKSLVVGFLVVLLLMVLGRFLLSAVSILDHWAHDAWEQALGRPLSELPAWLPVLLSVLSSLIGFFLIGVVLRLLLGGRLQQRTRAVIARIPGLRIVAKAATLILDALSTEDGQGGFRHFALVEGPPTYWSPCFVTGRLHWSPDGGEPRLYFNCYAPGNFLYSGRSFLAPAEKVRFVDLPMSDGVMAVLSCGGTLTQVLPGARIIPAAQMAAQVPAAPAPAVLLGTGGQAASGTPAAPPLPSAAPAAAPRDPVPANAADPASTGPACDGSAP